jgi:NADH/NAD ratio-sensing transcriptional regulator Rex
VRLRKELADETIKGRVAPGDSLQGLNHIQSHRKYLDEDTASVIMRAVSKGISWTEFVDVNASTLAKDYPELAEIGQQEYSYIR